jgi:hypothetical protein
MRDLEEAEARAARLEAELSHARGQPDHRYDAQLSHAEHPAGSGLDVGGLTRDCYARLQRRGYRYGGPPAAYGGHASVIRQWERGHAARGRGAH